MENDNGMLQGLVDIAERRIAEIRSGEKPALAPDANASYAAEVVVDLDLIDEPMIADPDVNNADVSKRYTHDTIRPISFYGADKKVDLGFVGSCMVHKGDVKIVAQMLRNLERHEGSVDFKAPLVVAAPTYNIIDELKVEGDWDILQKYSGFEFDDSSPKTEARTEYENILYLERPGCNLCMGNQEKAAKGDTVLATSTRLFKGRVVEDSDAKKGESLLASTPVVVLSAILGRTPTIDEYKTAVEGIDLTKFAPPPSARRPPSRRISRRVFTAGHHAPAGPPGGVFSRLPPCRRDPRRRGVQIVRRDVDADPVEPAFIGDKPGRAAADERVEDRAFLDRRQAVAHQVRRERRRMRGAGLLADPPDRSQRVRLRRQGEVLFAIR